jgi:hypothetical protein
MYSPVLPTVSAGWDTHLVGSRGKVVDVYVHEVPGSNLGIDTGVKIVLFCSDLTPCKIKGNVTHVPN